MGGFRQGFGAGKIGFFPNLHVTLDDGCQMSDVRE